MRLDNNTFAWLISDHVGAAREGWVEVLTMGGKRIKAYSVSWFEIPNL